MMDTLRESLHDYLAMRRSLGFKLPATGVPLPNFVSFTEEQQATYITKQLALEWPQQSGNAHSDDVSTDYGT